MLQGLNKYPDYCETKLVTPSAGGLDHDTVRYQIFLDWLEAVELEFVTVIDTVLVIGNLFGVHVDRVSVLLQYYQTD